jgi:hypothetical protein
MPSPEDLVRLADASLFIFTGSIAQTGASTVASVKADRTTVVVSVEDVIKAPTGLRGFAGSDVTVRLRESLAEGRYVFFADPMAIGGGIAVRERAHLAARERGRAEAAVKRDYAMLITRRAGAAAFVALGVVGLVRSLFPPAQWRKQVPWALASLDIEREIKGKGKVRRLTLIGPVRGSKRIPRAPALRAGLKAVFFLHRPPQDAMEYVPDDERQTAAFIADTSDIQPPDRLETIERIIRGEEQE